LEERNDERITFQGEEVSNRIDDYLTKLESNRGELGDIYDEMESIEEAYANNQPIIDNRPNSRVNILHANIEGQVAAIIEQNMAVACRGEGPSDAPFSNWARIGLDWTLRKNRIKRLLDTYVRRWEKFGWSWYGIGFAAEEINGFGLAKMYAVPSQNIFMDNKINDQFRKEDAGYIAEAILQTKDWAERQERFKRRAKNIFYGGTDRASIFQKDKTTDDEDAFWFIRWWSKTDGVLRLEEFSEDGVLLYDSFDDPEYKDKNGEQLPYYKRNKYPYFLTLMYPEEGKLYGFGDGKLLRPLQAMLNDLYDQIRRAAKPNRIFFDEASEVDLEDIESDDGAVPALDPNKNIRVVEVGKVNPALWQLLSNIHQEVQRVTRFSELMMGQGAKVKTATEASIQQQQGSSAIDHKKILLEETLTEMCEYALDLMMEHYTEGKAFRLDENTDDYEWIDFRQMNKVQAMMPTTNSFKKRFRKRHPGKEVPKWQQVDNETKSVDLDIEISIGAGLPKNKAFLWQMLDSLSKVMVDGQSVIKWNEFRDFIRDFLGVPLKDDEEIMGAIGQPMPGQPGIPGAPQAPMQGADVAGMSPNGAPMTSALPPAGGVA